MFADFGAPDSMFSHLVGIDRNSKRDKLRGWLENSFFGIWSKAGRNISDSESKKKYLSVQLYMKI